MGGGSSAGRPIGARLVLGVDLGSSSAKAVLADASGRIVARASVPQTVSRPTPDAAEQHAESWWAALRALVAATLGTLPAADQARLAGIAVSGHFPTLLLADEDGSPLAPAMLYGDRRADAFVDAAAALGGEALVGDEWLPKLLWLRAEQPALLARTRRVFNPHDHVAFRLTGERGLDHRSARRSGGLFDPAGLAWRAEVAAAAGLEPAALPPVRRAGDVLGRVTSAAAAVTGLPVGATVVVGLGDTPAELLGAGVIRTGDALLYYGTTTSCDVCTHDYAAYLRDPAPIAEWAPYHEVAYAVLGPVLPWVAGGLVMPSGAEAADAEHRIRRLDRAAAAIDPSIDGPYVLPYFLAHARPGQPIRRPAIVGLDANHGRADLHRALLESYAFSVRAGLEVAGRAPHSLRFVATGGGARSAFWRQLVSDTLGEPQSWLPEADAALGDAVLAALGTGDPDVLAGDAWGAAGGAPPTMPQRNAVALQDARYRTWLGLRDGLLGALNRPPA
jgi:xylulokinase